MSRLPSNVDVVVVRYITTLSLNPRVFEIKNFLKEEECTNIVNTALPHLSTSSVQTKDADRGKDASEWRVSNYHFLSSEVPLRCSSCHDISGAGSP